MLRKLVAGLGLGALAAGLVLGLAASTDLPDRLELTTYDWRMRLAADPKSRQQGHRPRRNQRQLTIREMSSRSSATGRGRGWRSSFVIDYLNRAPAKVVAVDLPLAEQDRSSVRHRRGERVDRQAERPRAGGLREEVRQRDHARRRRV